MRQAVNQEQCNMIDPVTQRSAVACGDGGQGADGIARGDRVEMVDIVEAMGNEMKAVLRKADRRQAVLVIASLGQFARTGAADGDHAFAVPVDGAGQRVAVKAMGTE